MVFLGFFLEFLKFLRVVAYPRLLDFPAALSEVVFQVDVHRASDCLSQWFQEYALVACLVSFG